MATNTYVIGEKTVLMSFGMLAECAAQIGDPTRMPQVVIEDTLRTGLLRSLLSERDKLGKITSEFNPFTCTYTPDELLKLLDWASEHVLDFFLNALQVAEKRAKASEEQIKALVPSDAGSKA